MLYEIEKPKLKYKFVRNKNNTTGQVKVSQKYFDIMETAFLILDLK